MHAEKNNLKAYCVVLITSLLFFYGFALNNIFNVLEPHITHDLGLSKTLTGLISSVFFYVEIVLLIPSGLLLDRFSPRILICIALIVSALGVLISANTHNIMSLILGRGLMGVGGAFSFIGCIRITVNWMPPEQLSKGTGLIVTMGILGGMIVQIPLTLAINSIGWRNSLTLVSAIGILIAAIILIVVRDRPTREIKQINPANINNLRLKTQFRIAFLNKQNWLCGIYTSLMNLPIFLLGALWGISYLTFVNGVNQVQASVICSMLFLGTMLGSPLVGIISDLQKSRIKIMKQGAFTSLALIFLIILFNPSNFYLLLVLYFALGLITSSQMISYPTVIESNSTKISSSATSIISILAMLGGAISQPLFGYIIYAVAHNHSSIFAYKAAIGILPISFLISFCTCFFIKETNCKTVVSA